MQAQSRRHWAWQVELQLDIGDGCPVNHVGVVLLKPGGAKDNGCLGRSDQMEMECLGVVTR